MITIEKFYFDHEEAADHITVSGDAVDYSLTFIGAEDAPVSLAIRMRGRDEFRKLIQQIYDMGIGITELPEGVSDPLVSPREASP